MRGVGGAVVRRHHEEGGEANAHVAVQLRRRVSTGVVVAQHRQMDDVYIEHVKVQPGNMYQSSDGLAIEWFYQTRWKLRQYSSS